MAVTVRRAVPDDAAALGRLHVRAWQWAYDGMLPADYLAGLADQTARREAMWRQIAELRDDQPLWVAERDGRVIGLCNTAPGRDQPPDTAELLSIYIDPDAVGTGVGAALMNEAVADMRARGYKQAILWVLEANDRGRRFYEKGGWRFDGVVKEEEMWGTTVREVRYRLDLV